MSEWKRYYRTISEFYPLRQLRLGCRKNLGKQFEIDLAAEHVDARDLDPDVVAEAELLPVAAAFDDVFFLVVVVGGEESEAD